MAGPRSHKLLARAEAVMPGGVNSPVRSFGSVGGEPCFIARGQGAYVYDVDSNQYIDHVCSWGPLILGHAHPELLDVIHEAAVRGTTFGAPTEVEVQFAEAVREAFPSMERMRCVSSGTEATMSALRLARGFTGRDKVIKMDGGYHGHADFLLVQAGSGAATLGIPGSAGVPKGTAQDTLVAPFNNIEAMRELFAANKGTIAALIVEPIPGNMGVTIAKPGYLAALRELAHAEGALLIFDEVISGFRVGPGGAQKLYGVRPDLTCLGKIVGGGLPAACFGGRADIMDKLAPLGPVYQAGTLSGNPLAMAAGKKTIELLSRKGVYDKLETLGAYLEHGLTQAAASANIPVTINRVGSLMTAFFTDKPVFDYEDAKACDTDRYAKYFRGMLAKGVYLAPSQFEAMFVSLAHTSEDLDRTIAAAGDVLKTL